MRCLEGGGIARKNFAAMGLDEVHRSVGFACGVVEACPCHCEGEAGGLREERSPTLLKM